MMILKKLLFFFYLFPFFILADNRLKTDGNHLGKARVTLKVAIEEIGYSPYNYKENGEIKGFTIDVLDYIKANSKYDFEFVTLPWPRALYLVAEGKVDLILTLFKNKKRAKTYHFIEPSYGYEINQLFTLADNNFQYNGGLKQLLPYSIGTKREFSYGKAFDSANYITKLPALTEEVLLKLLLTRRIDMAISNPYVFNQLIKKNNVISKVQAMEPYVAKTPVYLGLTKARADSKEIKETLGQLIKKFKAAPYYQVLLNKYQLNFK
ncbi:transporter substrate-binding domain-containing protein [Colwellia sp. BRX8-7]|jgi:polar amino acid transport system substrate-binding protein|uniref:substrate-binding periplasmic protein n=1 Tax=Colwellia sp. BRX8-7 TaxID=2759833 RepID=UPI0015F4C37B|nr:transporter substrate-binding domain-containing protein [Colwellia sp. BRX8-7]MBA6335948.1 transporter substrate-binding domain-containing protein [Colwellia sp. BRX8-7]